MCNISGIPTISINDICDMLNERVGKNLRLLRVMNNYSQEDVEIGVDISRSTLSKIENGIGKIDLNRLEKFANFFKVNVVTILTIPEKQNNYPIQTENLVNEVVETEYRKTDVELARCQEKSISLKKETAALKQEITNYKSQLKDKELIIKLLS